MGTIILVRHGENDWSKENKLAGRIAGVHLNETGHQQAQAAAQRLAALPIKAVYSSPLTRCIETAAYIADTHHLALQHVDDVGEVAYGEWEGEKIKKLAKKPLWRAVQFFPSRARFPQGEALREVQFRAIQAVEEVAAQHEKEMIVIVSHADIIRLLLAHYLGIHIDLFQRLVISPASASVLALSADGPVHVLRINDDGPLHPPAVPAPPRRGKGKDEKAPKNRRPAPPAPGTNGREQHQAALPLPTDGNGHPRAQLTDSAALVDEEE
ncbi:MAG: MSMEG_4193 family putative phosphomutase [Candidatus Promineofilum sp.]|nr:MSMEG_4193 family putative phosphomutase [Promineifilum sp.]